MFDIGDWFEENFDEFTDIVDDIVEKVEREYWRDADSAEHEKTVEVIAWEDRLEFCSIYVDEEYEVEETFTFPDPLTTDAAIDSMALKLSELKEHFFAKGFDGGMTWKEYSVPAVVLTWE